jgi:DNA-binding FrmR family transcriptional regulator
MKTIEQLLNNLNGQIDGIKRMINADKDCGEVIIQMKAVKSGLNNVMDKYIMENMTKCMAAGTKKDKIDEMGRLLKELTRN